jgi:alpha-beta hydrolase superfamily lysophospholipase
VTRVPLALLVPALLVVAHDAVAAGQPLQLRTTDGITLAATVYDAADAAAPAVVLVHMFTRTRDDWRPFAERLQASGVTALALDLRGHGGSGGAAAPSAAMGLDVQAAVTALAARPGVRRIGVVGASLGASAALLAAAELPLVRGVVLLSPASDYRGVRLDAALRKYGDRPMLLVTSSEDPYALRTVRGMVTDTTTAREQRVSPVAAHGSQLLERDPDVASALVDWLRRTLLS